MTATRQPDIQSLRSFGLIWATVFAVIAIWPWIYGGEPRVWATSVSGAFVVISLSFPRIYSISHFYQGWVRFGDALGAINSRIIMFVIFVVLFVPVSMIFRILRRDPLHRRPDPHATTYLIPREAQPGDMKHQF